MVSTRSIEDGDPAALGTRVRDAIRQVGINHSEVARRIGLDPSKLSKSLAGTRKFRVEEISRIAELTDVTTDWLTRGRGPEQPRRTITDAAPPSSTAADATPVSPVIDDSALPGPADAARTDEPWMSKGTRNRRRIVAAAWELYADRGIDAVRVHDIAEASGLTVSAINYHFRTKTQLLEAALRHSLEIIAAARNLLEPDDPAEVLRAFARVHAGVDPTVRRVWSIWIQSWARAVADERSRLNLAAVYGEWIDLMRGVLTTGQRAGQVRAGDTDIMVKGLSVFIDGLGVARSTLQMPLSDDDALRLIESFLDSHILVPPHTTTRGTPPRDPQPAQEASQEEGP